MTSEFKFYGVYSPTENQDHGTSKIFSNYDDVLKYCKENRRARFKGFNCEEEAIQFCNNGSFSGSGNPYCSVESLPFKALRSQDMFQLRKYIETNDYESVKRLIWKNPRYLISEGDRATILQEGARYNALHICAKFGYTIIAELILDTVSDPNYLKLLYGCEDGNQYSHVSSILIDSLLNTPDKTLNETPLHFAAKFGSLTTVKLFVSYPQCQKDRLNKFDQKPIDIICSRCSSIHVNIKTVTEEIKSLLEDRYLIPVWRSPVNDLPPVIGDPFSPTLVPTSPTKNNPLSPTMEIVALAGPMRYEDALEFRKKWKMPKRLDSSFHCQQTPSPMKYDTPHISRGVLIRNYTNVEKSVEKTGRDLAKKLNVKWREQWSFLKLFIDLRAEEGLQALEEYLKTKFLSTKDESDNSNSIKSQTMSKNFESDVSVSKSSSRILNSYSYLVDKLKSFSLVRKNETTNVLSSSDSSQKSWTDKFFECFCMNFSVQIVERIKECFVANKPTDDCLIFLFEETERLLQQIHGWEKVEHSTLPIEKVYKKAGELISDRLRTTNDSHAEYAVSVFDMALNNNKDELSSEGQLCSSTSVVVFDTFRYISEQVVNCLTSLNQTSLSETPKKSVNKSRSQFTNGELDDESPKAIICHDENPVFKTPDLTKAYSSRRKINFGNETEGLSENNDSNVRKLSDVTSNMADEKVARNGCNDVDTNAGSDDDDDDVTKFSTPPCSECNSDNEMDDVDEGQDIFLIGDFGSNLDIIIHDILMDVDISPIRYPFVYRWRHSMNLYVNRLRGGPGREDGS